MIHELQEYTKEGFEITFYNPEGHGLKVDVWTKQEDILIYCGWSFNEAMSEMVKYLEEKNA